MNKKHIPTEEIKKHTAAMRKFRMPALPLLTLSGVMEKPADNELEMDTIVPKHEEKNNENS